MNACSHTGGFPGRPCPWTCGTIVPEIATVEYPPAPVAVVGGEASGPGAVSLPPATLFAPDDAPLGAPGARGGGEAHRLGSAPAATIVPVVAVHGNGTGGPLSASPATGAPSHKGARNTDPDTAHEAARSITDPHRRSSYDAILDAIHEHGPLTDWQLAAELSLRLGVKTIATSAGKRRGELRDMGLVCDSGHKGPTETGPRKGARWALTAAGEREVIGGAA